MSKYFSFFILFFLCAFSKAQSNEVYNPLLLETITLQNSDFGILFSAVEDYSEQDTLRIYNCSFQIDSTIGFNLFVVDSAYLNYNEGVFAGALHSSGNDTLRAFAKIITYTMSGKIDFFFQSVDHDSNKYAQIGVEYTSAAYSNSVLSVIRLFFIDNRFIMFNCTGSINQTDRIEFLSSYFFNSLRIL